MRQADNLAGAVRDQARAVIRFILGLIERQRGVARERGGRGSRTALQSDPRIVGTDGALTCDEGHPAQRVVEAFLLDHRRVERHDQGRKAIGVLVHRCLSAEAVESLADTRRADSESGDPSAFRPESARRLATRVPSPWRRYGSEYEAVGST